MFKLREVCLLAVLTTLSAGAYAYVGPGLGAGTIGVLIGLITSILVALFALVWYPIKRLFKKSRNRSSESVNQP